MMKMCAMVYGLGLVHICSSDSSSANLTLIPLSITLNMIRGYEMFAIECARKLCKCGCSSFDVETINNEFRI